MCPRRPRSGRPREIVAGHQQRSSPEDLRSDRWGTERWKLGASTNILYQYPHRDSNTGLWLRRPTLYPLSYGGYFNASQFCHTAASLSNAPHLMHLPQASVTLSRAAHEASPTRQSQPLLQLYLVADRDTGKPMMRFVWTIRLDDSHLNARDPKPQPLISV